jgi:D-alanyl-D-alanine dipeptidase
VRKRVLANEGLRDVELSIADEVRIGLLANDIGAYAPVVLNGTDHISISELKNNVGVAEAAVKLGLTPHEASHLYVTFMGNLGRMQMQLDTTSTTAHGSGGSADVFLWDTKAGKPTCLGVPFDWVGPESDMDFFENSENLEGYKAKIDSDPVLRQHLEECGIRNVDVKVFNRIRDERRLLFHTMKAVGATFWKGESWHFNFGNKLGGFTFSGYPDAGSGCHSIIKNVRGFDGEYIAVWGNGEAHRQARAILGY